VNNEFERMWKEVTMAYFQVNRHFPGEIDENRDKLRQGSWSSGPDLIPGPNGCYAGLDNDIRC
jgi:hypothetical protein